MKMTKNMDMVHSFGQMGENILETGKKGSNMEGEHSSNQIVRAEKENGLMVEELNGLMKQ